MLNFLYEYRTQVAVFVMILFMASIYFAGHKKSLVMRPSMLKKPEMVHARTNIETFNEIIKSGKVAVIGGLSFLGKEGKITYVISVLKTEGKYVVGWSFILPKSSVSQSDIMRIDTYKDRVTRSPIPNSMVYFIGEADDALVQASASEDDLLHVARFVMQFISDDGPPKGVDW